MDLFLSAEERREVLRAYGRKHGLRVLVETGTNDGGTPWELKDDFDRIYTIELGERQWRAAVERFRDYPHIECLLGDSTDVLPKVVAQLDEPALFWLDGHHSGPGTAFGARSTPIREELHAIFAHNFCPAIPGGGWESELIYGSRVRRPHVIIVDDARIFEGGPEHDLYDHYADYPSLEWVAELARRHGYRYELLDDMIRLEP